MISLTKKNKIVEVLKVKQDFSHLKHHINNVYNHVFRLILVYPSNVELNKIKKICSPWIDKITFVLLDEASAVLSEECLLKVTSELKDFDINFDDVVCFSEPSEVPNFQDFDKVLDHLKYEPVILRMTNFVFNLKTHCKNRHMGSVCVNYSNLIQNPKSISILENFKREFFREGFYTVDNGNYFGFFNSNYKILEYFVQNNIQVSPEQLTECLSLHIHPSYFENKNKNFFVDFESEINFDFTYLEEFFLLESSSEKILIVLNIFENFIDETWCQEYFRVLNFNFTKNFNLPEFSSNGKIENVNIFLPNTELYSVQNSRKFDFIYSINEMKKKLFQSNIINDQNLDIIVFKDFWEPNSKSSFTWKDFKNISFEEFFSGI